MKRGEVGILNVGAGDTRLSFDPAKPEEREQAARIVTDMLRRGYAILVQVGEKDGKPLYQRATGFDPDTCEYLIAGTPPEVEHGTEKPSKPRKSRQGKPPVRAIPGEATHAVAVARSAGG